MSSRAVECGRPDARVADPGERRAHELVEHHVDEHDNEDECVRPRAVRDELLHDRALAPPLPNGGDELADREREEDRFKGEGDDPTEISQNVARYLKG